jgi:hypothetical protein
MGWGTGLSSDVLFTGCVNSTVNELYKQVNGIIGQFALPLGDGQNNFEQRSIRQSCAR